MAVRLLRTQLIVFLPVSAALLVLSYYSYGFENAYITAAISLAVFCFNIVFRRSELKRWLLPLDIAFFLLLAISVLRFSPVVDSESDWLYSIIVKHIMPFAVFAGVLTARYLPILELPERSKTTVFAAKTFISAAFVYFYVLVIDATASTVAYYAFMLFLN